MTQITALHAFGKTIEYDPTKEYGIWSKGRYERLNLTALQLGLAMADDPNKAISWLEREIEAQSHPEEPEQTGTGFPRAFLVSIDYSLRYHQNDSGVVHGNIANTIGLMNDIITALREPNKPSPTTHQPDQYHRE